MTGNRERRVARLEGANAPKMQGTPIIILMQVGETQEQAIQRIYGPAGLPEDHLTDLPVLMIQPVVAPPRED